MNRRSTDLSWGVIILLCLTIGLAPFRPPHIIEKLILLSRGELIRFLDWADLFLHGLPWVLLIRKIALSHRAGRARKEVSA